jgi:Tfp pilus assembly protein PilV
MMHKRLGIAGDTIVEVLLAITVVSAVLGAAFVSANKSLNASRQSQERGEALKLVEGQLERLKWLGLSADSDVYTAGSPFCITANNEVKALDPIDCNNDSLGITYELSIERMDNRFDVTADWDRAGGSGREELRIVYKMFPSQP